MTGIRWTSPGKPASWLALRSGSPSGATRSSTCHTPMSSHGRPRRAERGEQARPGRAAGDGERGAAPALDRVGEVAGDLGGGARGGIVVDDHGRRLARADHAPPTRRRALGRRRARRGSRGTQRVSGDA